MCVVTRWADAYRHRWREHKRLQNAVDRYQQDIDLSGSQVIWSLWMMTPMWSNRRHLKEQSALRILFFCMAKLLGEYDLNILMAQVSVWDLGILSVSLMVSFRRIDLFVIHDRKTVLCHLRAYAQPWCWLVGQPRLVCWLSNQR